MVESGSAQSEQEFKLERTTPADGKHRKNRKEGRGGLATQYRGNCRGCPGIKSLQTHKNTLIRRVGEGFSGVTAGNAVPRNPAYNKMEGDIDRKLGENPGNACCRKGDGSKKCPVSGETCSKFQCFKATLATTGTGRSISGGGASQGGKTLASQ